jgi:hypothetical protein
MSMELVANILAKYCTLLGGVILHYQSVRPSAFCVKQ